MRLDSLDGMREKTIGVALEAAGGLYRKLAKKFPRKGACTFKRRELATSRFPELVIQEEKRVRFVVVNGLDIIEKPAVTHTDDVEWFKSLTGRSDVAISPVDYKFYAPRHKYRRTGSNSVSSIPGFPTFPGADNSSQMSVAHGYQVWLPFGFSIGLADLGVAILILLIVVHGAILGGELGDTL
ncbi:putative Zinc finger C2HC domain-containing protein [Helianthus debilis subsp. tardiflorus]